jgi:hypothetical protein
MSMAGCVGPDLSYAQVQKTTSLTLFSAQQHPADKSALRGSVPNLDANRSIFKRMTSQPPWVICEADWWVATIWESGRALLLVLLSMLCMQMWQAVASSPEASCDGKV